MLLHLKFPGRGWTKYPYLYLSIKLLINPSILSLCRVGSVPPLSLWHRPAVHAMLWPECGDSEGLPTRHVESCTVWRRKALHQGRGCVPLKQAYISFFRLTLKCEGTFSSQWNADAHVWLHCLCICSHVKSPLNGSSSTLRGRVELLPIVVLSTSRELFGKLSLLDIALKMRPLNLEFFSLIPRDTFAPCRTVG